MLLALGSVILNPPAVGALGALPLWTAGGLSGVDLCP